MEELGLVEKVHTPAKVLVAFFDSTRLHDYLRMAGRLRAAGIGVEVYPEPKKLAAQLRYADRRGFRIALIAGEDEFAEGTCQLKDLATGESRTVATGNDARAVVTAVRDLLAADPPQGKI